MLRRDFLKTTGLAAIGLGLAPSLASASEGLSANAFVHVDPDGTVTIVCARSEMGQGVRSSLPVLIADEMGADVARIRVVQGDGDEVYGDQDTDGSKSVRTDFERLRRVGATARTMLVMAAAQRWGVPAAQCSASDHHVVHGKRSIGFGELVETATKLAVPTDATVKLRPQAELRHIGKELPLLDGLDIVTGKAIFAADVKLPGLLVAVIARPPVVGGTFTRYDATKTLAVPGVRRVVEIGPPKRPFVFQPLGGLAVVADTTWAAMRGRALLDVTWEAGDNGSYDSTTYKQTLLDSIGKPGEALRNVGDVDAALARTKHQIESTYYAPHLVHAPMEPPCAVARIVGDRCEVWSCTQSPQTTREVVAKNLGVPEKHVTVHVTLLGGAFGRKAKPDYDVEAAMVAKAMGAPVRVQWMREDDVQHGYYHTVSAQRFTAGLDDDKHVVAWHHRDAFPPIASTFNGSKRGGPGDLQQGVLDLPLAIPNVRAEVCDAPAHVRIGWLRSVSNIFHAWAGQSFIDELAHERGVDPLQNQLDLLGPPRIVSIHELGIAKLPNYGQSLSMHPVDTARHRRVLERVTTAAGWSDRKGRALGLAVHRSFLTYVAVVASVVKKGDTIAVDEVWIAADAGTIINVDRARSQLEGAVIFGMSIGLFGAITMKNGAVEQTNFRDYRLTRLREAPRAIHVELVASDGAPGGIGEPGVPPVAPAICNAIFALTGTRIRELPVSRTFSV